MIQVCFCYKGTQLRIRQIGRDVRQQNGSRLAEERCTVVEKSRALTAIVITAKNVQVLFFMIILPQSGCITDLNRKILRGKNMISLGRIKMIPKTPVSRELQKLFSLIKKIWNVSERFEPLLFISADQNTVATPNSHTVEKPKKGNTVLPRYDIFKFYNDPVSTIFCVEKCRNW